MKRCLFCCLVLFAGWAVAQPQSSGSGTAGQNDSGKTSSSPGSTGAKSSARSSSEKASVPTYPAAESPGQPGDEAEDSQESSSRDTVTDISPPSNDARDHPDSREAVSDLLATPPADSGDVQEFRPWNPMKALKDIEVGDYYFKRKNYKAAVERYKEALYYKDGDAIASFRLAACQEKLGDKAEARKYYEQYLKILPEGPLAKDARASLERLGKAQ